MRNAPINAVVVIHTVSIISAPSAPSVKGERKYHGVQNKVSALSTGANADLHPDKSVQTRVRLPPTRHMWGRVKLGDAWVACHVIVVVLC